MFARIVPRYDFMNRLMTAGQDVQWRRRAAQAARPAYARALDLATGTGDLALELRRQGAAGVVATDYCEPMLEAACAKLQRTGTVGVDLVVADALALPFADTTFDCVTSAFLLRNVVDLPGCLAEMRRVLRPGGRAVALELTHPPPGPAALAFALYFHGIMPRIGSLVADRGAYWYLSASLGAYPNAERLAALFREAGFGGVSYQRLGLGAVAIHVGQVSTS
jgi:demethylmenaquinone methyltransferase/2-methoxy-6-polyprenyl-1,4-benzoquinol methylase